MQHPPTKRVTAQYLPVICPMRALQCVHQFRVSKCICRAHYRWPQPKNYLHTTPGSGHCHYHSPYMQAGDRNWTSSRKPELFQFTSTNPELEPGRTLFGSRSVPADPLARRLAFSRSCSSCLTARRASLSLRSFSRRRAFDSNSCQSPCRSLSLDICQYKLCGGSRVMRQLTQQPAWVPAPP